MDDKREKILKELRERNKGNQATFSQFFKTKTKHINLTVANALEQSTQREHKTINKTIRNLRYCSTLSLNTIDFTGKLNNIKSSKRCKNANCATCRRSKSARLGYRLTAAMADENNTDIFKDKDYYFLTLTLRHDENIRNYNYLQDFKNYQKKLRRLDSFKKAFEGGISSIENVISDEYHIHSHSLLTARKGQNPREIHEAIRADWIRITGDSFMVDLQLIDSEEVQKMVLEVVKYSTKIMKLDELTDKMTEKLAEWIIETKGRNFTNLLGTWSSLDITKDKSIYDIKSEQNDINDSDIVILSRTSKNSFNFSTSRTYSKFGKEKMKEYLIIKDIDTEAIIADGSEGAVLQSLCTSEALEANFNEIKKDYDWITKGLLNNDDETEAPF